MEYRNLEHVGFEELFAGFQRAFSDYDISFGKEEVRSMLRRRGYDPRLSFGAFDGGEMVAFTFNGIGKYDGRPTAYDTGTGTVKEYRGQGIAGEIFRHSLPHLRDAGIEQYLLEVLQTNQRAIGVYCRMGFEVTREFDCFRQSVDEISGLRVGEEMRHACEIIPVDAETVAAMSGFCDFAPSWQNDLSSIERGAADLVCLGAYMEGEAAGYCVFDPTTGDLTQIAVGQEWRRGGVGRLLLAKALEGMRTSFVKILNVDSEDVTLPAFLAGHNIPLASRQYEMILPL